MKFLLLSLSLIFCFNTFAESQINIAFIEKVIKKQCDNDSSNKINFQPVKDGFITTYKTVYECKNAVIVMTYEENNQYLLQSSHVSKLSIHQNGELLANYEFKNDKEANRINFVLNATYQRNNGGKLANIEKIEKNRKLEALIK